MQFRLLLTLLLLCTNSFAQKNIISLWQKGNIAAKKSNKEALKCYQDVLDLAKKEKNFIWQANVLTDISGAYFGLRNYQKGAESCKQGLKIIEEQNLKTDSVKFKLYSALAANYKSLYLVSDAQDTYAIANKIIEANPALEGQIPLYAAYHFSNQGALWLKLHDIQRSELFYEKALSISRKIPDKSDFALILANLSKFYFINKDYSRGIALQAEAITFYKQSRQYNKLELAKMYFMLGLLYTKSLDFTKADNNFIACRQICHQEKNLPEYQYYYDLSNLESCRVTIRKKQLSEAKNALDKIDIGKLSANTIEDYWEIYGEYHFANKNFDKALQCYQDVLKIIDLKPSAKDNSTNQIRVFETTESISEIFRQKYYHTKAISDAQKSLSALEECIKTGRFIRQNFYNVESKAYFTDKYYRIYKEALNLAFVLYQQNHNISAKVFALAEESKAVVLFDKQALNAHFRNNVSDSLLFQLNLNQGYLSYYKNQDEKDSKLINEYAFKVNQTLEKIKYANQSFAKSYQTNTALTDIPAIQRLLPPGSIYLNYIIYQNQLLLVAIDKTNLYFRKTDLNIAEYTSHQRNLAQILTTEPEIYEGFSAGKSCEYFYDLLIRKVFPEIKNYKRLIVNPDNSFYDISFDILRDKNTGSFLIEKFPVTYTNNIGSVIGSSTQKGGISEKWNVFLPIPDSDETLESGLKPLKFSFAEIKGIISNLFVREKASKEEFLSKLQSDEKRIVMIVTHAKSENGDPYLIFNGKNAKESKLYASELQFIKTKAPMVVLSACETNAGKTLDGLGVQSFSKSLELSGCKTVVGSFWKVDDKSLSVLASLFYRNLMDGMEKDIALQKAKLLYLETTTGKQNDLPFYWAHLQVIGDNSPIVNKFNRFIMFIFTAVGLSSLLIIYRFFKRRASLPKSGS